MRSWPRAEAIAAPSGPHTVENHESFHASFWKARSGERDHRLVGYGVLRLTLFLLPSRRLAVSGKGSESLRAARPRHGLVESRPAAHDLFV